MRRPARPRSRSTVQAGKMHGVEAARAEIVDDLLHRHQRALGGEHGFLLHAENSFEQHVAVAIGPQRMNHRDIRAMRGNGRQRLAGKGTGHAFDFRIHLRQIGADIAAEDGARQTGGARLIGIRHRGMRMFLDFELVRPAVFDRVAQAMQRADAGIAAPGENELFRAAHADELIVEQIRRHPDQGEMLSALADHLMAGGVRNEMGEAFHRHHVAVADDGLDGLGERQNTRHCGTSLGTLSPRAVLIYEPPRGGSNGRLSTFEETAWIRRAKLRS